MIEGGIKMKAINLSEHMVPLIFNLQNIFKFETY